MIKLDNTIYKFELSDFIFTNTTIFEKFSQYRDHKNTKKSHYFDGRYENIYISSTLIPELHTILNLSHQCVNKITDKNNLKSGLWFNEMLPGNKTLAHTHDDSNEIYSGVYYIKVPNNSGDLVLEGTEEKFTVKPKEGMLILFPPNTLHYVTENKSNSIRLSLGINIGTSS